MGENYRIKNWMKWTMLAVAVFVDLVELILGIFVVGEMGVDTGISAAATVGFTIWFWILGVTFSKSPSMLTAMGIQGIIGLIPAVDAFVPEITVGVWYTIKSSRTEDMSAIMEEVPA